jgi:hypothetical protein
MWTDNDLYVYWYSHNIIIHTSRSHTRIHLNQERGEKQKRENWQPSTLIIIATTSTVHVHVHVYAIHWVAVAIISIYSDTCRHNPFRARLTQCHWLENYPKTHTCTIKTWNMADKYIHSHTHTPNNIILTFRPSHKFHFCTNHNIFYAGEEFSLSRLGEWLSIQNSNFHVQCTDYYYAPLLCTCTATCTCTCSRACNVHVHNNYASYTQLYYIIFCGYHEYRL